MIVLKTIYRILILAIALAHSNIGFGQKHATYPINSTTSDDYSDLVFFDSLVVDKQIVFLGESHHGIEDFNEMKFRIIRYLHENHDFNLVVFEAGVHEAALTNILKDSLNSLEMLTQSLMGYWRTESNCAMMKYFSDNQIDIAGMDVVSHSLPPKKKWYSQIYENQKIAERFFELDSLFYFEYRFGVLDYIGDWEGSILDQRLDSLAEYLLVNYSEAVDELAQIQTNNLSLLLWANKTIIEELKITRKLSGEYINPADFWRDSTMVLNLEYAVKSIYPNQKTIVWAHDGHIAKTGNYQNGTSMGMFLSPAIEEQSFVISLSAINGTYREGYLPLKNVELENHNIERKYKRIKSKGVYISSESIHYRKYGNMIGLLYSQDLSSMFDGYLFIEDVTGSELIKYGAPNNCE